MWCYLYFIIEISIYSLILLDALVIKVKQQVEKPEYGYA